MAERSFEREVQDLRLQAGEVFRGEGILAITKALLQSGVSYVAGYQGAPISHLMDVLADAKDVMSDLGVHFETSASEAAAAATLSASVMYPVRGAVTWKSTAGTNVAADALSNLASSGVTGGALIVIGEDYGEGSSIMQERSHAYAMKSQIWLLDPRPDLPTLVRMVEEGFELSEASNSPVMLEVRIRTCHVHGQFVAKDNKKPAFTLRQALENPVRDVNRIVLPPASYMQEKEKLEKRWPAAVEFIKSRKLNEFFGPRHGPVGVIVLGGLFNGVLRALQQLGLADVYGETSVPIYVLNVAYPIIEDEMVEFCLGKSAVLMVEEGAPDYLEQALNTLLRRRDIQTKVAGKDVLPMGGEYTAPVVVTGVRAFLLAHAPQLLRNQPPVPDPAPVLAHEKVKALAKAVPPRPPGFCIGCPERPIFAAMKLVEKELGQHHISADIGCHLFSILPPFNIGTTTMGYGLGPASASAFNVKSDRRVISVMGDGGFWHNGLATSIGNAVFNKQDGVTLIVDNFYSAATGGQDIPSSRALNPRRKTNNSIVDAVKGVGATWVRQIDRTYDVAKMRDTLREALTTKSRRPEDHRRLVRMHAQQTAARAALVLEASRGGRARREGAVRRRRGHLLGRPRLHPPLGLPVAVAEAHGRPAQGRSGRRRGQWMRRLRQLRRGRGGRCPLPLLLPHRGHLQSEPVGPAACRFSRARHRLAPTAPRSSSDRLCVRPLVLWRRFPFSLKEKGVPVCRKNIPRCQ